MGFFFFFFLPFYSFLWFLRATYSLVITPRVTIRPLNREPTFILSAALFPSSYPINPPPFFSPYTQHHSLSDGHAESAEADSRRIRSHAPSRGLSEDEDGEEEEGGKSSVGGEGLLSSEPGD